MHKSSLTLPSIVLHIILIGIFALFPVPRRMLFNITYFMYPEMVAAYVSRCTSLIFSWIRSGCPHFIVSKQMRNPEAGGYLYINKLIYINLS